MERKAGQTRTKSFEFMTLFMMVLGTVVGSGIYMKNSELLQQTKNPIIGIILWLVVGIVCVLSVIVFMEISSSTRHFGNGTMGNWTKLFINRKVASFFSLTYVFMYMPSCYAFFTGSFVTFLLQAIGKEITPSIQLTIYLVAGIVILLGFTTINVLKPIIGEKLQFFGTIFKFIPLIIALIAGFCLIDKNSVMFNDGYAGNDWNTHQWDPSLFLRGFGAILFSFDGYVYICNAQKGVTHKEQVPKALFAGMVFVTAFYLLIAISLFLGSPDGSIVSLFEKMFAGGKSGSDISLGVRNASRITSNILLMIICLLNVNVFTIIGATSIESDADAKLLFIGKDKTSVSHAKTAFFQVGVSIVVYVVFILIGFLATSHGWNGIHTNLDWVKEHVFHGSSKDLNNQALIYFLNKPSEYLGIIASADTAIAFIMIDVLIFAAVINRKTNKVKVEKYGGVVSCGIISGIFMFLFSILGIYAFIDPDPTHKTPWVQTSGIWFTVSMIVSLSIVLIVFLIQEHFFKKYPFKNGFKGELSAEHKKIPSWDEVFFPSKTTRKDKVKRR